jgi:gliding motility-associated protein GldC
MNQSTITIEVELNEQKFPQRISWKATDSTADSPQLAKAMSLSFWNAPDKVAMGLDLWTTEMMVDEMADFYYQTMMNMANSLNRSTKNTELVNDMRDFAGSFYKKFRDQQLKENKLK